MECRKFEITLVSAENLPDIRNFGQMKVYAEVSLNGESKTSKKTNADMVGKTNPRWNCPLGYTISESSIKAQEYRVVVKLYCERTLGDKCIGADVKIPVKSLLDSRTRSVNEQSYVVPGTPDGRLNISYSFGDMFLAPKLSPAICWKKAMEGGGGGGCTRSNVFLNRRQQYLLVETKTKSDPKVYLFLLIMKECNVVLV